jgi:hypothetical protein
MKTILMLVAAVGLAVGAVGCATSAGVNTPVADVGAGASVGR